MTEVPRSSVFENLDSLRLSPADLGAAAGIPVMTHVPLRKPLRHEFFRVNSDPTRSLTTSVYIDRAEMRNDTYLVMPAMRAALIGETKPVLLLPFVTRQDVLGVWPMSLPIDDGRRNAWFDSAREASERAKCRWLRMAADLSLGAYRIYEAVGDLPDPVWPNMSLNEILAIAFSGRVIDSEERPVVQRLRGAA